MPESIFQTRSGETDGLTVCFAVFLSAVFLSAVFLL